LKTFLLRALILSSTTWHLALATSVLHADEPQYPIEPTILVDEPFNACEGIAFNGEGRLFVSCNKALWEVNHDSAPRKLFDLESNLGLAAYGPRDVLVADFGPTSAFQQDRNHDGLIFHATPEGAKSTFATGIGDPNAIVVRADGSLLVSDDATADIYSVTPAGEVRLFSTAVSHPNGLLLSDDGRTLYVARIFHSIRPVVFDNTVWAIRLDEDGTPHASAPRLVFSTDPGGGNDGLAIDTLGRLYVSTPRTGKLWRYDPASGQTVLIAEGMPGIAGLAFGRGDFDPLSIYAAATFAQGQGGKIYRIPVGIAGRN
jgi:sugar lactone lactonase YvrE